MDISLLTQELSPQDNPGLDTFDPRFDEIVTEVEKADYLNAAHKIEEAMSQNIYDIRLIGYFLYGYFIEQGPAKLSEVLNALVCVFNENFEHFGPVKNKEKQAQSSLKWFFSKLIKKLQHEEKRNTETWLQWQQKTITTEVEEAIEQCEAFRRALSARLEDKAAPIIESNTKLNSWLEDFHSMARPVITEAPQEEVADDEPEADQQEVAEAVTATSKSVNQSGYSPLAGSSKLNSLKLKIEAFGKLCQLGDTARAAIVMEDLEDIIKNFKPQEYYPRQFTTYFNAMAKHIKVMAPYWQDKNSISWQALERLYDIDPQSFLNLDI